MKYVLEKIGEREEKMILHHASSDEKKLRMLEARGGFFNNNPELSYAVEKEIGCYLVLAPRSNYTTLAREYYFYFDNKLHRLSRDSWSSNRIVIWDVPNIDKQSTFKAEVEEAFHVYGFLGLGPKNEVISTFEFNLGGVK